MPSPTQKWIEIPEVCRQIELAATVAADRKRRDFIKAFRNMYRCNYPSSMESPLEAIFFVWWDAVTDFDCYHPTFQLHSQRQVTCGDINYRLDFSVELSDPEEYRMFAAAGHPFPKIAVEVDGHEFHEKTREQVAYRNARDRDLQQAGWKVFHFSWMELVTDGSEHVSGVAVFAYEAVRRAEEAIRNAREEEESADAAAGYKARGTTREAT